MVGFRRVFGVCVCVCVNCIVVVFCDIEGIGFWCFYHVGGVLVFLACGCWKGFYACV